MAVPTIDTLNALTDVVWAEKTLVDNCIKGTPVLDYLKKGARKAGGTGIKFDVKYGRLGGGFRAYNGIMTLTTPEIVTKGTMAWSHAYVPVQLEQLEIDYNESDPDSIASYINNYVQSALDTMREKILSPAIFTAQTGDAPYSLVDAIDDGDAVYAGIDPTWTGMDQWRSYVVQAGGGTGISPYIGNFRKIIRELKDISGKKPDMIVCESGLFDKLGEQIVTNDNLSGMRKNQVVEWGYDALHIDGVPVVTDMDFDANCCPDAFVTGGTTKETRKGSGAMFLNFDHLYMYYLKQRWFSWDKMGWVSPTNTTQYINKIHWSGNIVCTERRAQARLWNVDLDIDPSDYELYDTATQSNKSDFTS